MPPSLCARAPPCKPPRSAPDGGEQPADVLAVGPLFCKAKVADLDDGRTTAVQQGVVQLEVAVRYMVRVAVLDGRQELLREGGRGEREGRHYL